MLDIPLPPLPPKFDVFSCPPPAFSDGELVHVARTLFGLEGTITALDSERDQNVRLQTSGGDFVLKVANQAETESELDMQIAALRHVAQVRSDLLVPRVVPTVGGDGLGTWGETDARHLVRCVSYLPGTPFAVANRTADTYRELGMALGQLSSALAGFGHRAAHRDDFVWNLDTAQGCRIFIDDINEEADRVLVREVFDRHAERVVPALGMLRRAVIHQDANDYNVVVSSDGKVGLIDFGDMVFGCQINELAIALAYALMDVDDIVAMSRLVIGGYVSRFALHETEVDVLFDLVTTRLAMSVAISSHRTAAFSSNDYLRISQAPALRLLRRLHTIRPDFLKAAARKCAGFSATPGHDAIVAWIDSPECQPFPVLAFDLVRSPRFRVELRNGCPGTQFGRDASAYWAWLQERFRAQYPPMSDSSDAFAVGAYLENRDVYDDDAYNTDAPERRSVHLGIDIFVPEDTPVCAMLNAVVYTVVDNPDPYDYGPTVILRHETGDGTPFFVLYGHLSRRTLNTVSPGQVVSAGDVIGFIGSAQVNGGWAPHLHVQIMTDLLGNMSGNFEGAGEPSRIDLWRDICPNPNLLLRLSPESFDALPIEPEPLLARRADVLGASLSVSYRHALPIMRGSGTYLIDATGRAYLDCVNNVAHVGHAHPHVVDAQARQAAQLNTNTRYLHRVVLDYADRLADLFPDPLQVVYFVNSGSEANELAMRLARTATGRHDMITLDWAYHGNTNDAIEISPYKFNRPGGRGCPPHVQVAMLADPYRGPFGNDAGAYAESVQACIRATLAHDRRGPAAFIAESISGCGGQVEFADGYLAAAFNAARTAGALCIADEVQVGFGRVGDAMWAFEAQRVVPDIVTLGKPMGNGHPLAAVVTTRAIADAFHNGMEYFNTFGGNTVSCAVGMAVLDVIEHGGLRSHAQTTGQHLISSLREVQGRHEAIGEVRGRGLFIGIDLVTDRRTKEPATMLAGDVANALRHRGVLVSTDGPDGNVIKIKPPLVFGVTDADVLCHELGEALRSFA